MKISSEIGSAARIVGEEKAIELMGKAGFDAWDFSMFEMAKRNRVTKMFEPSNHPLQSSNYRKFAKSLRHIGEECGMVCNQSHAPFPVFCPEIRSYLKRAIECTAIAGGEICVIHPDNNKSAIENAEMYLELLPFAKEHGVKIAVENMWNYDAELDLALPAACSHHDDFTAHLRAVNDDYFVACLDIGHAEMAGLDTSAEKMIFALGDKLKALHIHDNDKRHDSHQIPFSMQIDFGAVVSALKKIGYDGYITLEADRYLEPYSSESIGNGVKNLAAAARRLAKMFD